MKYGVIDVGSNSVRLLISENGKSLKKLINTTRLAEGKKDGLLLEQSSLRTLKAIKEFVGLARENGADKIYVFATAAVRNAKNGKDFASAVKKECGYDLDIVSGDTEAEIGVIGALKGKDGAVLDIGGGSTEIAVIKDSKCVYTKSIPIGAVVLTEKFGQNAEKILEYAKNAVKDFGDVPKAEFYCIGGTCTSLAAVSLKLAEYDPERVDGYKFTQDTLFALASRISGLSVEERKGLAGLQKERADIIHAGACIFRAVAEYVGAKTFTVSESDNLEGYLAYITEKK
ncbi:MAG: hypothetical protein VZQ61_02105 [Christensenellaceae bacterium]